VPAHGENRHGAREGALQSRFDVGAADAVGGWRCEVGRCRRTI
jgi:hypothetical protein